jgi:hypothetical protein
MSDDPFAGSVNNEEDFEVTVDVSRAPEGIAIVQLVNVSHEISRSSGNKMWVWEFVLCEYLEPNDVGEEFRGELLKVYTALSKAAMWKLEETLGALGVTIEGNGAVKFKKDELIGVIAKAVIKHNEFNGKIQVNIDALTVPTEGAGTKRDLPILGHGVSDGGPSAPPVDDNIPF